MNVHGAYYAARDRKLIRADIYHGLAVTIAGDTIEQLRLLFDTQAQSAPLLADRTWAVDLPGTPASIPLLRRWARQLLAGTDLERLAGDAELVASELGTNALLHTRSGDPGGRIRVEITYNGSHLKIAVYDDGPRTCEIADASTFGHPQEHGRGLKVVETIAVKLDEADIAGNGHVVRAMIGHHA